MPIAGTPPPLTQYPRQIPTAVPGSQGVKKMEIDINMERKAVNSPSPDRVDLSTLLDQLVVKEAQMKETEEREKHICKNKNKNTDQNPSPTTKGDGKA